jgi:starch synthase (maltosyl-transferring)
MVGANSSGMEDGRRRVVISEVTPEIDGGRFPIKRTVGELVAVRAAIFAEGHDRLAAALLHRREGDAAWIRKPMEELGDDLWEASFVPAGVGRHRYTLVAWIDEFSTWRDGIRRKLEAGLDLTVDLRVGAELVAAAADRTSGDEADALRRWLDVLLGDPARAAVGALDPALATLVAASPDLRFATTYGAELGVVVDRERARFGSWYEMFPRSCAGDGRHGTFADCEARLPYVAEMGFDVLYLPPIHPIGTTHRKGRNNTPVAKPGDPGSPWAVGSDAGGHTAIEPALGDLGAFRSLLRRAQELGLEVALDLAFQCSPDHPWVTQHPEWFRHRPDGSVQYAENPPKRYEDIFPFHFGCEGWRDLWEALAGVVDHWVDEGVRIFRVDNPHTKPFAFWEWLIARTRERHPEVIFLAEAFTTPRVMYRLAKVGFTQSYTFFTWRNLGWQLTSFMRELTRPPLKEFYRPNLWPNTPDILTEFLQTGGRPGFALRAMLAATLSASWGIYGPAFELCEARATAEGSEEYLDSEKYQVRRWDRDAPQSLRPLVTRLNAVRRDNPALQSNDSLHFHAADNELLLCYSKQSAENVVLVVANLDPHHAQSGWVTLDLAALGLEERQPYTVHDLLGGARFFWHGRRNFVELDPAAAPGLVLQVRRRLRTERDFEYYL